MATYSNSRALQNALDATIAALRQQTTAGQNQPAPAGEEEEDIAIRGWRGSGPFAAKGTDAARTITTEIDKRIERLGTVRDWIDEDESLAQLIDSVMGQQIKAAERRQRRFSILLNIVFLLAGWWLSLVGTPATVSSLLHHA